MKEMWSLRFDLPYEVYQNEEVFVDLKNWLKN